MALFPFAQAIAIMGQGARRRAQDPFEHRAQGAEQGRKILEPLTTRLGYPTINQIGTLITLK